MLPEIELSRTTNESNTANVEKYITWGNQLLTHKEDLPFGAWLPTIKKEYGQDKIRTIQIAMKLAKSDIPTSLYPLGVKGILDHLKDIKGKTKGKKILKQHTSRKNPNKQFIESHFIQLSNSFLEGDLTPCLTVTGPDYNRHVNALFNSIANHVYIVENSNSVFRRICNWAKLCPYHKANKVSLLNVDINKIFIPDCRYIDLDLMANIFELAPAITKHVANQKLTCDNNSIKCFTFTASTRNDGGPEIRFEKFKDLINNVFDASLTGFQGDDLFGDGIQFKSLEVGERKYCKRHLPLFKDMGRIINMGVIGYADEGTPMMSVLIIYK